MALYQLQHTIPYFTAIPEDVVTNVFHFEHNDVVAPPTGIDLINLADAVKTFFNGCYGSVLGNTATMAKYARPALARQKIYRMADVKPRVPILDSVVPLTALNQDAASSTLPSEVSVCSSFQGVYVSGSSRASQRGRIFLGALGNGWVTPSLSSAFPKPSTSATAEALLSADNLQSNALASGWTWVIYSPTTLSSTNVTRGWIDDAFDTQRRRGQAPSSRSLWTA